MQDLKALEGKSLAELREIAKALGIEDVMVKKRELIEKITGDSVQETPAENKGKRGRKKETPAAETPAGTAPETAAPETLSQALRQWESNINHLLRSDTSVLLCQAIVRFHNRRRC